MSTKKIVCAVARTLLLPCLRKQIVFVLALALLYPLITLGRSPINTEIDFSSRSLGDTLSSLQDNNAPDDDCFRTLYQEEKEWTFLVYMAADNDLCDFAQLNLIQMMQIGSNHRINILVHLDIHKRGESKVTKRLYVEKGRILRIGPDYCMDSGAAATLIDALEWAHNDFPSKHFALVFWNHGSGDLNPSLRKTINPANLFRYNPETNMVEVDRRIGFIDFIEELRIKEEEEECDQLPTQKRGICFDETNGTYLDDNKLIQALGHIFNKRKQKKIDLIIFDACLMAGTGTACIMSKFADFMVASEEVVLGPGYNYKLVLEPLANLSNIHPIEFAKHIVECYHTTYKKLTNDYTHSAFTLNIFEELNQNIDELAQLLIYALNEQIKTTVTQAIKLSRSRQQCTYFDEPSYIDLHNLYTNLLRTVDKIKLKSPQNTTETIAKIKETLRSGIAIMGRMIIANVTGKNLAQAKGVSIYFPEYKMYGPHHKSYEYTDFARHNTWREFLKNYLS